MPRVVIVGGGISGLATAYRLQQLRPDAEITVLESQSRLGGTVWTERREGFQFEVGANGFLDNKPSTLRLCGALGIQSQLIAAGPAARHRYLFHQGRLEALPESLWSFLRSPLLTWRAKAAILSERYRRAHAADTDESFHDFVTRRTNAEVAETLGDAFVTGIHAADPRLLSAAAAFPRLTEWERVHGSILRGMKHAGRVRHAEAKARGEPTSVGSRLISFPGGLRTLIDALQAALRKPPLLSVAATTVRREEHSWLVHADGRGPWSADAVVLACPAYRQADLIADQDSVLAEAMHSIPYAPAVVVALGYRRADVPNRLDGFGFITPQRLRRDILGVQWCSSIFPDRAPAGMVLLRVIAGGWNRPEIANWDDSQVLAAVAAELRVAMRVQAPPVLNHVIRWSKAIPQYHLGHRERIRRIEFLAQQHAGLFVTGNAYHGVALNDCTEQAESVGQRVAAYLAGLNH